MGRTAAIWTVLLRAALLLSFLCFAGAAGNPHEDNRFSLSPYSPTAAVTAVIVLQVAVLLDAGSAWLAVKRARAAGDRHSPLAEANSVLNYFVVFFSTLALVIFLAAGENGVPPAVAWAARILLAIVLLFKFVFVAIMRIKGPQRIYDLGNPLALISSSIVSILALGYVVYSVGGTGFFLVLPILAIAIMAGVANWRLQRLSV